MTLGHQQYWDETQYEDHDLDFDDLTLSVEPTERIGAPLPNRRKARLRRIFVSIVLMAGAWLFVANGPGPDGLIASAKDLLAVVVSNAREIAARAHQESVPAPVLASSASVGLEGPSPFPAQAEQSSEPESLPELVPTQDEKAAPTADETVSTETIGAAYTEPAAPAEEGKDKSPKRKHAIEAGLSPDLPNVLLTRLSKADLQNGAYAIRTALAKTPDDAKFSWPPSPSRQQALFEVRFVPGASQGCRRYIVTVTKHRWSSTSAAMEKCGEVQSHTG